MRLVLLLALLGLGFYGVTGMRLPPPEQRAAPAPATPEPQPVVAAAPAAPSLPDTVRRLAESPVTGPRRPVILSEAVIDPAAVQPLASAAVARVVPVAVNDSFSGNLRRVTANSANVRGGPSTGYEVVGRLSRGEEVEVLESDPSGWVMIRLQGDGLEGWMAARLLGD